MNSTAALLKAIYQERHYFSHAAPPLVWNKLPPDDVFRKQLYAIDGCFSRLAKVTSNDKDDLPAAVNFCRMQGHAPNECDEHHVSHMTPRLEMWPSQYKTTQELAATANMLDSLRGRRVLFLGDSTTAHAWIAGVCSTMVTRGVTDFAQHLESSKAVCLQMDPHVPIVNDLRERRGTWCFHDAFSGSSMLYTRAQGHGDLVDQRIRYVLQHTMRPDDLIVANTGVSFNFDVNSLHTGLHPPGRRQAFASQAARRSVEELAQRYEYVFASLTRSARASRAHLIWKETVPQHFETATGFHVAKNTSLHETNRNSTVGTTNSTRTGLTCAPALSPGQVELGANLRNEVANACARRHRLSVLPLWKPLAKAGKLYAKPGQDCLHLALPAVLVEASIIAHGLEEEIAHNGSLLGRSDR